MSSAFKSPRSARGGSKSKKRDADPANGSTYRAPPSGQNARRRESTGLLLPAHRINGLTMACPKDLVDQDLGLARSDQHSGPAGSLARANLRQEGALLRQVEGHVVQGTARDAAA